MSPSSLTALFAKYARLVKYGDRPKPVRDWALIITSTLLLLLGSAGWSYWLFLNFSADDSAAAASASASAINAPLDTVKALFLERAATRERYQNTHFVDPSK